MRKLAFFLGFVFLLLSSFAQKPLYSHQQWFKVEDGLPQAFVSGIVQDDDGFIWLSTLDGLARYDGREFRVFQQVSADGTGISSNVIVRMSLDKDRKLWLSYHGLHLDVFNTSTLQLDRRDFTPLHKFLRKDPHTITEDRSKFWTVPETDGIRWINISTFDTGYANVKGGLLKEGNIRAMAFQPDGGLWVLSNNHIQVSDSTRRHFTCVSLKNSISDLKITQNVQWVILGDEMVVVADGKLCFVNSKTGDLRQYNLPFTSSAGGYQSLIKGGDGKLYLRSFTGVYRVTIDGNMTLLWENNLVTGRGIVSFMVDRSEVLWVALDAGGLVKVNLRSMPLEPHGYQYNFHTDVLLESGVPFHEIPEPWKQGSYSYDFRYAYGVDSTLYLVRNDVSLLGGNVMGYRNKRLFTLPFPTDVKMPFFRGLCADNNGGIWALDEYHRAVWYWKDDRSMPVRYNVNFGSYQADLLAHMAVDDNFQWITTYGLGLYKVKKGDIVEHADRNTKLNDIPFDLTEICADPSDPKKLWIGSRGGGLIQWYIDGKQRRIFTTADGLPNNTIYCIVPDRSGKLWLSTNKGICRFDPQTYEVHNFEKSDGLPGLEFNRSHEFLFPDGRIAMGGIEGYVIFQPADFRQAKDTDALSIQITDISVNNKPLSYSDKNSLLQAPLTSLQEITLSYDQNYLNISFAALKFNEPQKIRYRYRLKGFADYWVESGHNNTAYYTQLDPGTYEFEINATNLDGNWSKDARTLKIVVLPPIWQTWWAYTFYALIFVTAIIYYLKYRERRLKARQQLQFEQHERERLRELDEVKTRFFTNITHELRTPLTLIIAPIDKMAIDPQLPAPFADTVRIVQRNADKLLGLINQLLDISKIDAGQMKVQLSTGEMERFVQNIVATFNQAAKEKKIRLELNTGDVHGLYRFDEEKWERILTNLLSNAFKFTPEGGYIIVQLARKNKEVELSVSDSGAGIPIDQQKKIFDRFYQADGSSTRSHEGTGIGLSLVKELVRIMEGTIRVESLPGKGSSFIISMPVDQVEAMDAAISSENSMTAQEQNGQTYKGDREQPLILVAEDNDELRSFIAGSIAQHWRVLQAADGEVAWEMIIAEMPDLVISDVMMPRMSGIELCSRCKTDPRTGHIGFVLLTAKVTQENKMEGFEQGADEYITKPFHLPELELRIQNILRTQEKTREFLRSRLLSAYTVEESKPLLNPFIEKLYAIIGEHLDDLALGVEQLAASMNMSRSTLNRKLKVMVGLSANDLIRQYRLQQASQMLREGMDIATAAYRSGFSSPSYFAQCFKEQFGTTPSLFVKDGRA